MRTLLFCLAATAALAGCGGPATVTTAAAKTYPVTGTVVALDVAKKTVKLDHRDIPGLMKAMTMEFAVSDPTLLDGLKPGDAVEGTLTTEGGGNTVTALRKR
jgi:Cu/Ag efflux protein CusF